MDTSKMLQLVNLDLNKIFALFGQSGELVNIARNFYETLDLALIRNQIVEVMNEYDLGTVTDVYEIFGGYVNRSFGVYTEKKGQRFEYFIRKYKDGVTEKEILFEHSLIDFSIANGLEIAARIYRTRDGRSFVRKTIGNGESAKEFYYAVYQYLPGEDKYTWIDNRLTDAEYASSAEVLAAFHSAARNFDPKGLERVEPKIMELLPTLPEIFKGYADTDLNNPFHEYYLQNFEAIVAEIKRTVIPPEDLAKMPVVPIHCDYHPGNLKFENLKAVGIFDFDWSKIDLRLFDLGLGMVYFCSSWRDEDDGTLRLDKCSVFLRAYQNKLKELGGLEPINEVEKKYLPELLAAGNMYLIFWCLRAYYGDLSLNVFEYRAYLQHQVRCMNWIINHRAEILEMAQSI